MSWGIFQFYKECLARAFSGVFWRIEKWTGGLSVLALVLTKAIDAPEAVEQMIDVDVPLYFFIAVFSATVFLGFVTAPYKIYAEERKKRENLEFNRKPRFEVFLKSPNLENISRGGNTIEMLAGNRQTAISMFTPSAACLYVKNIGENSAIRCKAQLLKVSSVGALGRKKLEIIEPIFMTWSKENIDELIIDIEPNVTRRIFIAGVRETGQIWIYRRIDSLPVNYQQVFGSEGEFEFLIQISADNSPAVQVLMHIKSSAADKNPPPGIVKGKGEMSILSVGSPALSHADTGS